MKNIALGIHVGHDRGACIIINKKVEAVLSQERLDRVKYSQSPIIPFEAIDAVLKQCQLSVEDIGCIGLSFVAADGERLLQTYKTEFFTHYCCGYIPFFWVNHHDAHAYTSYFSSGFKKGLIFVSDGGGDFWMDKQEAETLYSGYNGVITRVDQRFQDLCIRRMQDPINHIYPAMPPAVKSLELSLGRKYAQITHLLGFNFGEAGKTMGLASYGKSFFDFSNYLYRDLTFSLTYSDLIKEMYILQTLSGLSHKNFIDAQKENIASTVQAFTEHIVVSLIQSFAMKYHCDTFCLSGGVFLNCLTNHKILEKTDVKQIFIPPCAGDDGQALGAAYYAYNQYYGAVTSYTIDLPYLGLCYSNQEILEVIKKKGLQYEFMNDEHLTASMAKFIAEGKIIALHRGKTEIGPRALCHRSILANPAEPHMKDYLNNRVKHREPFRPFAPTVVSDDQFKYFDLLDTSDYMLYASTVKEPYRKDLASITHVDNTARIQAISKESDSFIYMFLKKLEKETGYPIVLNTSFNVAGQPIVESPLDAINTFLATDIDCLIIGNYLICKSNNTL